MGKAQHENASQAKFEDLMSIDDNVYREPHSVNITENWETSMEDFLDDFEDYQDIDFPTPDRDL